jgi:hypothetical protein
MTGDLAATGLNPSWQQLTSLINPQVLGKELALMNKETINGVSVEYYSGILNGIATEIDWLPSLQLPARLLKKQSEGSVSLTLTTCNKNALTAKPLSKTDYDKLRRFDYTDLGDMEDDPLVRHLEQLIGGHAH